MKKCTKASQLKNANEKIRNKSFHVSLHNHWQNLETFIWSICSSEWITDCCVRKCESTISFVYKSMSVSKWTFISISRSLFWEPIVSNELKLSCCAIK